MGMANMKQSLQQACSAGAGPNKKMMRAGPQHMPAAAHLPRSEACTSHRSSRIIVARRSSVRVMAAPGPAGSATPQHRAQLQDLTSKALLAKGFTEAEVHVLLQVSPGDGRLLSMLDS